MSDVYDKTNFDLTENCFQANNPVYGISNYVDVVPAQNQVAYLDPSQMFTLQQQQQQQATQPQQQQATQQQVTTTVPSTQNQTTEMAVSRSILKFEQYLVREEWNSRVKELIYSSHSMTRTYKIVPRCLQQAVTYLR